MISTDALIPSIRTADPAEVPEMLGLLDFEQIKPIARDICGITKIGKDATAESLGKLIVKTLNAERSLAPARPELGAMVLDEESGEQVEITDALRLKVMELSHRLQQGEHSLVSAAAEICRVIKEFRDERGYLYFGYSSFKAYCDAGQLKVLGGTRSRRWAYDKISIIETLGDDVVQRAAQLSQRDMLKLGQVLNNEGMEATLETLKGKQLLVYRDDDGREASLPLPKSAEDVAAWRDAIQTLHRQAQSAKRSALTAEDTLVTEREGWSREAQEYSSHITNLETELAEKAGLGDVLEKELAETKDYTPTQIAKLKKDWQDTRASMKRIQGDLTDARQQQERLAEQIEKHQQLAAAHGTLKLTRSLTNEMIRLTDEAIDAVSELRAMGEDLPTNSMDLLRDSVIRCESQFRQLGDELTRMGEAS